MEKQKCNYIYIAESLDGFIAQEDAGVAWLDMLPATEEVEQHFRAFMQSVDALVMGRHTFEIVQSFGVWPYDKQVVVLSSSLGCLPQGFSGKARLSAKGIEELLCELHEEGLERLYIDGGKVIQSFLELDLIDEMNLARLPILLGKGIRLFGQLERSLAFRHIESCTLGNGLTISKYRRDRANFPL